MKKTKEQRLKFVVKMLADFDLNKQNKGDVLCPLGVCVDQLQKIIKEVEEEQKQIRTAEFLNP